MSSNLPMGICARNVNGALPSGMMLLKNSGVKTSSRGLEVIEYPGPVTTTYLNPRERVLFDPVRDANPFFHFFEALWIIAGRQDVEFLAQFNANMRNYSDDGKVFHAPYGYRIRRPQFDQLARLVSHLHKKPDSRQAVLQIWDYWLDLDRESKDIPCNDMVFFKIRDNELNMTVCCRSNDIVWGAYGANVVQFSMLQEYVAAILDINVGRYYQMSDSFHMYTSLPFVQNWNGSYQSTTDYYEQGLVEPYALFAEPETVLPGLENMFNEWDLFQTIGVHSIGEDFKYECPLITEVAMPMYLSWLQHKAKKPEVALHYADQIAASDWRMACGQWLKRRIDK